MNSYSEFNFSHLSAIVKLDELSTSLKFEKLLEPAKSKIKIMDDIQLERQKKLKRPTNNC